MSRQARRPRGCRVFRYFTHCGHSQPPDARRYFGGVLVIGSGAMSVVHDLSFRGGQFGGDLERGNVQMMSMGPPQQGQRLRSTPMRSRNRSR